jgi:hypothetical protein
MTSTPEEAMLREKEAGTLPGGVMVVLLFVLTVGSLVTMIRTALDGWGADSWASLIVFVVSAISVFGLFVVTPNEAKVLVLFGSYAGSVKRAGFHWANPFMSRKRVSQRIRNFESPKLKVNDLTGNPIEIAAVAVWRVVDTAEAVFEVDDYKNFVQVQTEAAVRNLATSYRTTHTSTARWRCAAIRRRSPSGCAPRSRIARQGRRRGDRVAHQPSRLCARDRRRDAAAPAGERHRRGARSVSSRARSAWSRWRWRGSPKDVVQLDEERKAAMVSNLLVVLCSDQHTQPVVNTGTLYT